MSFSGQLPVHGPNRDQFIERMGKVAGFEFHFLWQESRRIVQLHDELNKLVRLSFQERLILDRELSGFHRMVHDALWRDLVLGVCALSETTTVTETRGVSLPAWCGRHLKVVEAAWYAGLVADLEKLSARIETIRSFRNKYVAHADRERVFTEHQESADLSEVWSLLILICSSIRHIEDGHDLQHWFIEPVFGGVSAFLALVPGMPNPWEVRTGEGV